MHRDPFEAIWFWVWLAAMLMFTILPTRSTARLVDRIERFPHPSIDPTIPL